VGRKQGIGEVGELVLFDSWNDPLRINRRRRSLMPLGRIQNIRGVQRLVKEEHGERLRSCQFPKKAEKEGGGGGAL